MRKPILIVMVGNIGSGKTTLCNKFVKAGFVIISRDGLRYMIGNGKYIFDKKLESGIFNAERKILIEFMKLNANIVLDGVNCSKSLRTSYTLLAESYYYRSIAIVMPKLTMKKSVDRRMNNPHDYSSKKLWETVWKKFDWGYKKPTLKEGFNKVIFYGRKNSSK